MNEPIGVSLVVVEEAAKRWHDGLVPANREAFVNRIVAAYMPAPEELWTKTGKFATVEAWKRQRDAMAELLREAAAALAEEQNSRWKN
jgi:hypothetical protein